MGLGAVLIGAVGLVYSRSLLHGFIFDDRPAILENPTIRRLWPIWEALRPPRENPMSGRPLANLTLAVNYALGGLKPWGYRAANMGLHAAAAVVLWRLLSRLLLTEGVAERRMYLPLAGVIAAERRAY